MRFIIFIFDAIIIGIIVTILWLAYEAGKESIKQKGGEKKE